MTARLKVRETYLVIDGAELVAVEWLAADGTTTCGHTEFPVAEWRQFIHEAGRGTHPLLDRALCGGCGHDPHLDEPCNAAIFELHARTTDVYCSCASVESDTAHAPVAEPNGRLRLITGEKALDLAYEDVDDYLACQREEANL